MSYLRLLSSFFVGASLTACTSSPILNEQAIDSVGNTQVTDNFIIGLDKKFLEVNSRVPDFAGMYFNNEGNLIVLLSDSDLDELSSTDINKRKSEITEILSDVLGENVLEPGIHENRGDGSPIKTGRESEITLKKAKHTFQDLVRWRMNSDRLLASPDVLSTDVDERNNRVVIGITSAEIEEKLRAALTSMEIPSDAFEIVVDRRDAEYKDLRDDFNPPPGGVQIEIDTALLGFSTCTLGFNANLGFKVGFVTNDHCGKKSGEVNSDSVHQPTDSLNPFSFDRIGIESVDPAPFTDGSCSPNQKCRYSDSMFVRYTTAQGDDIAEPESWNSESLELSGANDTLVVTDTVPTIISGAILDKIGRTTGWTYGRVGETCRHTSPVGSQITRLCQSYVDVLPGRSYDMSRSGDSGSPVFRWVGDGTAHIAGILWGGPVDPPKDYFVFSSLEGIKTDLGGSLRPSDIYVPPVVSPPCGPASSNCCEVGMHNYKPICLVCAAKFGLCPIDTTPLLSKLWE